MTWYVYDGPSELLILPGRRSVALYRDVPTELDGEFAERVERAINPPKGREVRVRQRIRRATDAEVAAYRERVARLQRGDEEPDEELDEELDEGSDEELDEGSDEGRDGLDLSPAAVRAWAETQGLDYPKRGRLPDSLVAAYMEAHGG